MYSPHTQVPARAMNVVLRTDGDPAALTADACAAQIRALDPDLPIYNVRTMAQRVDESLARRRFSMLLLTLFAALALGLASDRHLRRHGVSGEPGNARARDPDGAGRDAARHPDDGGPPRR